jgi:N4-(beta-N-acetylglucosaminyl)-L-asparaginase
MFPPGAFMNRRDFIKTGSVIGTGVMAFKSLFSQTRGAVSSLPEFNPVVIANGNGIEAVKKAYELISAGADALDALIAGVTIVEDDPDNHSVGYGGLPNEDGVVELDASCMHGPTHSAGAVAALRNIKNPSKVAKLVMERTDHVLLVGEGALRFAKAHGFREENLLTEEARRLWLEWKENMSDKDHWFPNGDKSEAEHSYLESMRITGTINCNALDASGNLSGVTSTSGMAYKIPGRIGDSPIIGAGLYVDNEIGACGSTGRGEENLKNLGSFMVVEYMRQGKSPTEACLLVCRRILDHALGRGLKDKQGIPTFTLSFHAINKKGEYGAAVLKAKVPSYFCVCDEKGARNEEVAYLIKI